MAAFGFWSRVRSIVATVEGSKPDRSSPTAT
jgi:hypothetical protein